MGPRLVNIDLDTLCAFRRHNLALINESVVNRMKNQIGFPHPDSESG